MQKDRMQRMVWRGWCAGVAVCIFLVGLALANRAVGDQRVPIQYPTAQKHNFQEVGILDDKIGEACRVFLQLEPYVCYAVICDRGHRFKSPAIDCVR